MNGDEATSLFLCIQVRMMAKGFASGSYEAPRIAFVCSGEDGGGGGYLAKGSESASPPGPAAVWEKHRRQVNSLQSSGTNGREGPSWQALGEAAEAYEW